jgi:hypothetical protein
VILGPTQGGFQLVPREEGSTIQSRRRRILWGTIAALAATGLALALALERRPAWYRPYALSESHLQAARMEALRILDSVSDRMVQGEPFEIVLSDHQLNVWLAGLDRIWPEAARQFPSFVADPFVKFTPDAMDVAARVESKGWRAIVSTRYTLALSHDKSTLTVGLSSATCGSMGLPRSLVAAALPARVGVGGRGYDVAGLFNGLTLANRFVWPNGRRAFRLSEVTVNSGSVRIRIEPD